MVEPTHRSTRQQLPIDPVEDTVFSPELKSLLEDSGENSMTAKSTNPQPATPAGGVKYNLD